MIINTYPNKIEMGTEAARCAAELLQKALSARGEAYLILATGASQFEMLNSLVKSKIEWSKVTVFHLDEYIGLPISHPASFRKYLKERFEQQVISLRKFHYVNGEIDPRIECQRLGELINHLTIDVACIGIGENGHLAFNDPPADFDTREPYIIVDLDSACRQQQVGEGWFTSLEDVPKQAISMSIRQIMKSAAIVCTVPDTRKAMAVKNTVEGPVTNLVPASILQTHPRCWLFLDEPAAVKLQR
jgi:glucosamine-6-phosphate deaminase